MNADKLGNEVWDEEESPIQSGLRIIPPDWHFRARCNSSVNDEMFFPEIIERKQLRMVKVFCRECPVFSECLTHALTKPERNGVWAGTSQRTRARIGKMVETGDTTVAQVVSDYMDGKERRYESLEGDQGD